MRTKSPFVRHPHAYHRFIIFMDRELGDNSKESLSWNSVMNVRSGGAMECVKLWVVTTPTLVWYSTTSATLSVLRL